ncbi:MAG: peptidylprolyl isomerase [Nitrospirae bacterium]|nr:peptidylprolyl isomerase [Nitrospirota bacterium]
MKKTFFLTSISSILIVTLFISQSSYGSVLLDRIVAVVNDEVITWSELRNAIALDGKTLLEKVPEGQREEAMRGLEKEFLSNLIDMKLQVQEARRNGLDVGGPEITNAIDEIKKKYSLTEETLMRSLEAEGMTPGDYKARLGEQILLSKVVHFEVKANIVISDREIEEYYNANKGAFEGREKFRIRQIFFASARDDSRKTAVGARAYEVMQRINNGEDFSKLAGEYSEDPSKQFGGDLGYITKGSVLKEVEDMAAALKTGEVSKPFWSSAGLHIIKLEDSIKGEGPDKVKDRIKEILFEKAFDTKYREWKAGLKEKAYIEIKL